MYNRRDMWRGLDAEVVPYHWDDRELYCRDYIYLQDVYKFILHQTALALNCFHGVDHSVRYWRILIGPWLYFFIHTLFDRWVMLLRATSRYKISNTLILRQSDLEMLPIDMSEFQRLIFDDPWNHFIFGNIIKLQRGFKWKEDNVFVPDASEIKPRVPVRRSTKRALYEKISRVFGSLTRKNEVFIIQSHLPRLDEIRLQLSLGQLPKLWYSPKIERCAPDFSMRDAFALDANQQDDFVRFVCFMIPRQIPVTYLEGYNQIQTIIATLPWPSAPKVIFTSNAYECDEVFKLWAATKVEMGSRFVIGQHGGFFGAGKWTAGEDHQVEIADRFLTWGWNDSRQSVYPAVALANLHKPFGKWRHDGHLLLITVPISRYCWKSMSWPTAANQSEYFVTAQLRFAGLLRPEILEKMVLRLDRRFDDIQKTFYWNRWENAYPEVTLDPSTKPIEPLMYNCRLCVSTYNATTLLVSLGQDIPTIMFWDPAYFELRESAIPYFERLKQIGIFHETPESAAAKVVEVWDDVAGWWNRPEVQEIRRFFCDRFARSSPSPLQVLKQALIFGE